MPDKCSRNMAYKIPYVQSQMKSCCPCFLCIHALPCVCFVSTLKRDLLYFISDFTFWYQITFKIFAFCFWSSFPKKTDSNAEEMKSEFGHSGFFFLIKSTFVVIFITEKLKRWWSLALALSWNLWKESFSPASCSSSLLQVNRKVLISETNG